MTEKPYIPNNKSLDIRIKIEGNETVLDMFLKKAEVHYELNKIPTAKLRFLTTNPDQEKENESLKNDAIAVTKTIEVLVKNDDEYVTLFKGIISRHDQNADPESGFETKIECKDLSINLISEQEVIPDESFQEKMDRFLNHVTLDNQIDLESWGERIVSKTSNISPWDYLLSYLDSLGLMTTIKAGVFKAVKITVDPEGAAYIAQNGVNVFHFEGREEPSAANVKIKTWNAETQTIDEQEHATKAHCGEGCEVIDLSQTNYSTETVGQMLLARAAKNRLTCAKGKVKTYGNNSAHYGEYIKFEKVNATLEDRLFIISAEHHTIENGCWDTEYDFGLENNNSFSQNISSSTTSNEERLGQTNTMHGLQIGIVTKIDGDEQNQHRIKVRIPAIAETGDGVWARLSSMQAGPNRGSFFIPEVDDEVVLGCFNNNPDTPVILGKLYSSAHEPPYPIEEENFIQGIVSKEGTRIIIDDEKKCVEISTLNGNKLLVSDDEKGFSFEDENNNKLTINEKGITLKSTKDIILEATGKIKIKGAENTIKADGNMKLNGALIKLN